MTYDELRQHFEDAVQVLEQFGTEDMRYYKYLLDNANRGQTNERG